jgi:hypothetical protein
MYRRWWSRAGVLSSWRVHRACYWRISTRRGWWELGWCLSIDSWELLCSGRRCHRFALLLMFDNYDGEWRFGVPLLLLLFLLL